MSVKLWEPDVVRKKSARLSRFIEQCNKECGTSIEEYSDLYAFSLKNLDRFWGLVWTFCDVKASVQPKKNFTPGEEIYAARWFEGARLNFAENLLRRDDDSRAVLFWGEEKVTIELSYRELARRSKAVSRWLVSRGVTVGDRIVAVLPNAPEALIAMLGVSGCGAVWSAVSPDFGTEAIISRFSQISPRVLFLTQGYFFRGKWIECAAKAQALREAIPSLEEIVLVPYGGEPGQIASDSTWSEILQSSEAQYNFAQLPADAPLAILYSSGTTGAPKCIVHSVAGTLLEHLKEHQLHTDIRQGDPVFYQTSCSWMMWNWLMSALASGASLVLYDGDPLARNGQILFDLTDSAETAVFGTNAKFLSIIEKDGLAPGKSHKLSKLRTFLSTGSPLLDSGFEYVYREIKSDVCLSSISGGTDIIGCFALGSPISPVYRGELQVRSLGLDVQVFDEGGRSLIGEKGELVCCNSFPSMPREFWNDSDGRRYHAAYFEKYPNVWHHGDYALLNEHGGVVVYGRSDTTLKPGGVRIGTAEIYRQVETVNEIRESLAVGQTWKGDVRIVLFVVLQAGIVLDDALREKIRSAVRKGTSPFHVPKMIIQISDLPRTRSGKNVEKAVKDIIDGTPVLNRDALANPDVLDQIMRIEELKRD